MSKRKRRCRIYGIAFCVLILIVLFTLLPFNTTKTFDASDYNYTLDYSIELDDIRVFSQETNHTCYAVSMVILNNYLGVETTEQELIEKLKLQDRGKGMLPSEYLFYANKIFNTANHSVSLLNPKSEAEILNIITASLIDGLPIVFFYATADDWNKPHYNTHYSVIYGIDMEEKIVKLSNPYGFFEELSFEELFNGLTFQTYKSEPFTHLLGRKVGYIKNNNLFVLEEIV